MKASYATKDTKTQFQVKMNSKGTSDPVKVIGSVEDNDIDNDKPASVELPQSKPVIPEVDTTKGNTCSSGYDLDIHYL